MGTDWCSDGQNYVFDWKAMDISDNVLILKVGNSVKFHRHMGKKYFIRFKEISTLAKYFLRSKKSDTRF